MNNPGDSSGITPNRDMCSVLLRLRAQGRIATASTNCRERHGRTFSRETTDWCSGLMPTVRAAGAPDTRVAMRRGLAGTPDTRVAMRRGF